MKLKTPTYNWRNYKFGSISLCMIMRDNAALLPRCLDNLKGLVHEIVIVDTGSKDNSIEIAQSYGAIVLSDPWQDDFARPRNIGLLRATKEWILIMDPDEVLLPRDHQRVRWLTREPRFAAWWLTTHNYNPGMADMNFRTIAPGTDPLGMYPGFVPSTKTRFFKNGLGVKFVGCWHELVDWYLLQNKMLIGSSDVVIHHWAHEIAQKDHHAKILFSLKMGEKKVREWPGNGQCWWELAVAESILGYRERAAQHIAHAIKLGFAGKEQYFTLARILRILGDKKKADLAFEKGTCIIYPSLTHIDPSFRPTPALIDGM